MKTIILVHGSYQGAYAWNRLSIMLKEKGYTVLAPALPGHGRNEVDVKNLSFSDYIAAIAEVVRESMGEIILIGHSMGGLVVSAVADLLPHKVGQLVYVAGLVPDNGLSLLDIGAGDKESLWGSVIEASQDPYRLYMKKEEIIPVLCQDLPTEMESLVLDNYHPEPLIPFTEPIFVSQERWGKTLKHYVLCLNDRSISFGHQKEMINKAGITSTYTLESGHTPQLTMPERLLDAILGMIG